MLNRTVPMIVLVLTCMTATGGAAEEPKTTSSPAEGFTIHVMAPHKFEDGTVHGPYHHYCKPISAEVLQCLLFDSTESNARLTDIEYFIAKPIARELPLAT